LFVFGGSCPKVEQQSDGRVVVSANHMLQSLQLSPPEFAVLEHYFKKPLTRRIELSLPLMLQPGYHVSTECAGESTEENASEANQGNQDVFTHVHKITCL
jgi:hypothetical protein